MGHTWKGYVKEYVEKLNQTCLDGKLERLVGYFADDSAITSEVARWARVREQQTDRGIRPLASTIKVVPLSTSDQQEEMIHTTLLIHQRMFYEQDKQTFLQENYRAQEIHLKPDKYGWAFIRPWGWYQEKLNSAKKPNADPKDSNEEKKTAPAVAANEAGTTGTATEAEAKTEAEAEVEANEAEATETTGGSEARPVDVIPSDPPADKMPDESNSAVPTARRRPHYSRTKAVEYAETYWKNPNPAFKTFEVDCTNFVSQCLYAGGIPMLFSQNRGKGWWYKGSSWSWSWAVANALYHLLKTGGVPFYAKQVDSPSKLEIGDVICYDFDGDGHWQHNTFVVAKDGNGMPLVNARTTDSRHRYWEYLDSSAYTPRIRYAFFHIYGNRPD